MVVTTVLQMIYIQFTKPFEEPFLNHLETFNEVTVLVASYHLLCFTEYMNDPPYELKVGYSLIAITCFNILVNIIIVVMNVVQQFKLILKRLCSKRRRYHSENAVEPL